MEGSNASAEGEDADDTEDQAETKLNIVRDFQLDQFPPAADKKAFQGDLKSKWWHLFASLSFGY